MTRPFILLGVSLLFVAGCGTPRKVLRVTSFPPGATIWVDGKQQGQTDNDRVMVDFTYKKEISVRVDKDGYQSQGKLLSLDQVNDQDTKGLFFVLEQAPDNKGIKDKLQSIDSHLEKISTNIERSLESKKDK